MKMNNDQFIDRRTVLRNVLLGAAAVAAARTVGGQTILPSPGGEVPSQTDAQSLAAKVADLKAMSPAAIPVTEDITIPHGSAYRRMDAQEVIWAKIVPKLEELSPLDKDGHIKTDYLNIEEGFSATQASNSSAFRELHIEPLLDQAADLLDRGVRDRAAWDDNAAKAFNLALELNEYRDLDTIHTQEEKDGFYTVDAVQSGGEQKAEEANEYVSGEAQKMVDRILEEVFSDDQIQKLHEAATYQAVCQSLCGYTFEEGKEPKYFTHSIGNKSNTIPKLLIDQGWAAEAVFHGCWAERQGLVLQESTFAFSAYLSKIRAKTAAARAAWDLKNIEHRKNRSKVARTYQDIRAKAAIDPKGVLNYKKRLDPLKERFRNDFSEALARLNVIANGLRIVYGYDEPLPNGAQNDQFFDDTLLWVRKTIDWLRAFSRAEQNCAVVYSVKRAAGKNWAAGLSKGFWTFDATKDDFKDLAHVRLRGVSAFVQSEGDGGEDVWRVIVQAPRQTSFVHLSGKEQTYTQSVPPCRLGRVWSRKSNRDPEVAGVAALFNASPIGAWTVALDETSVSGQPRAIIKDVQLS